MNYYTSLFKGIIEKRKLIWDLAKADFKKRFVGSYFGVVWMFVQPLVTILIYAFLFGEYGFKSPPPVPGGFLCHLDGSGNCALVLLQRSPEFRHKLPSGVPLPGEKGSVSGGNASDYQADFLLYGTRLLSGNYGGLLPGGRLFPHRDLDSGTVLLLCSVHAGPGSYLYYELYPGIF